MHKLLKTIAITITVSAVFLNLLLAFNDANMDSSISEAKEKKRIELLQKGAKDSEIREAMDSEEQKIKLINQWEDVTVSDYLEATLLAAIGGFLIGVIIYYLFVAKRYRKSMLLILIALSILPALWRAYIYGTDARGLIILSSLDSSKYSFNPYSKDGGFISPCMAKWIFINAQSLYAECSNFSEIQNLCGSPLVNYTGNGLDYGDDEATERQYEILDTLILRGEPIENRMNGLTPLNQAILYNNHRYAAILLEAGADPYARIDIPGKEYHDYTSMQFLKYLQRKTKNDLSKIQSILEKSLNNNLSNDHL